LLQELVNKVSNELKNSRDKIIILKADKAIEYNKVINVLDMINSIEGEKYVALATKQK